MHPQHARAFQGPQSLYGHQMSSRLPRLWSLPCCSGGCARQLKTEPSSESSSKDVNPSAGKQRFYFTHKDPKRRWRRRHRRTLNCTGRTWVLLLVPEESERSCSGPERLMATSQNLRCPAELLLLLLLLLTCSALPGPCAGAHTLRYDLMAFHAAGSGQSQFLALGYLDHELFLRYDGDSRRAQPRGLGMKGHVGAETWARETEDLQEKEQQLRRMLEEVMGQKGQDRGFHTLQAALGCEIEGNSTGGFWRLGYDGQDLLILDPETLTWKAARPSAESSKMLWKRHGPRPDLVRTFLYDMCPNQLQKLLTTRKDQVVDAGPPALTVAHCTESLQLCTLTCSAILPCACTGSLAFLRDGEPVRQHAFGPGNSLPNGDGTYQTWVTTKIHPGEEPRFTCRMQHCGQNTEIRAGLGQQAQRTVGVIITVAALGVFFVLMLMFWMLRWVLRRQHRRWSTQGSIC